MEKVRWVNASKAIKSDSGFEIFVLIIALILLGSSIAGLSMFVAPREYSTNSLIAFLLALIIFSVQFHWVNSSEYGSLQLEDSEYYEAFADGFKKHFEGRSIWVWAPNKPDHWVILPEGVKTYKPSSAELKKWSENYPNSTPYLWLPNKTEHLVSKFDGPVTYPLVIAGFMHLTATESSSFVYVQLILLASLAQIMFLISSAVLQSRKWGWLVWSLLLADTGFIAVGAYLLKDSLVVWTIYLLSLMILAICKGSTSRLVPSIVIGVGLVTLSSLLRYPLYFSVVISLLFLSISLKGLATAKKFTLFAIAVLGILGSVAALGGFDDLGKKDKVLDHLSFPIHLARTTFYRQSVIELDKVKKDTTKVDESMSLEAASSSENISVSNRALGSSTLSNDDSSEKSQDYEIKVTVRTDKVFRKAIVTVARTLFAPYPWAIFKQGMIGSWPELLYPGMVLWIVGLPFALLFLPEAIRSKDPVLYFMLGVTIICAFGYMAYDGEYSTRVRVMSMPLAWLMVAGGIRSVWFRWKKS